MAEQPSTTTTWDISMSQTDMMIKDTVLVLDENDNVIGSASKKLSHDFSTETPRGILHRAFSVFLFDESTGEMLLQKRASTKITFPNVWTNTCCSHPLHGMSPPEIDTPRDVTDGTTPGVKNAAIRKLHHELGIPRDTFQPSDFKFLTRFHYWAADTVTHGPAAPWGEHEIDYVLFVVTKKEELKMEIHPEEVDEVKWVSREGLKEEMKVGLWSPWFRIIAEKWIMPEGGWWEDLEKTMKGKWDEKILRFDPPQEHMGGKGKAGTWLGGVDDSVDSLSGSSSTRILTLTLLVALSTFILAVVSSIKCLYALYTGTTIPSLEQPKILCALSLLTSLTYILHARSVFMVSQLNMPIIPSPLPILGSVYAFATHSPWDLMSQWHRELGGIYSFTLMGRRCVAVSSPDYLRTILQSKIQFTKKDKPFSYKPFLPLLGRGIVTSEGQEWMRQRTSVGSVLRINVLEKIPDITIRAVQRLGHKLDEAASKNESIEIAEELRHLTLQVISETFFSLQPGECDETFAQMYLPIVEEGNKRVWEPYRAYAFFTKTFWDYQYNVSKLNQYVETLITNRYHQRLAGIPPKGDVLDHVMSTYEKKIGWSADAVVQLRDEMKTFMLAGHETSAAMMTWTLYELLKNRELVREVEEEAKRVFEDWDWLNGEERVFGKEELEALDLTQNCLKESLRKYSVVPTVSRHVIDDIKVGPHLIPRGTTLFVSIQGIHHDPLYHPSPHQFNPRRFSGSLKPYTFIPFLEGPRNCLGQYLALLESKMVVAMLLQRYKFRLADEVLGEGEMRHRYMVPVIPKCDVHVWIEKKV